MVKATKITPACAGNTKRSMVELLFCMGSPPLARGIPIRYRHSFVVFGITPACAGNTYLITYRNLQNRDHPRLRGEYFG